jgi:hypothetical protein
MVLGDLEEVRIADIVVGVQGTAEDIVDIGPVHSQVRVFVVVDRLQVAEVLAAS